MDFGLDEHQVQLLDAAGRWTTEQIDREVVRSADGRTRLWGQLIEMGWLDLLGTASETEGGSLLDAALLTERLAEGRCPLPVSSALASGLVAETAGLSAPGPAPLLAGAVAGSRSLVGRHLDLDTGLVLARRQTSQAAGFSGWELADAEPGTVTIETLQEEETTSLHRPIDGVEGEVDWQPADEHRLASAWLAGAVLSAAELVGLAQATVTESSRYAKDRVQGGKPIGGHQAIQHRLADMLGYMERCRYLMYAAAASAAKGLDVELAHQAKALAARDCLTVIRSGHQVMGAIAFSAEHALPASHKQALVAALEFGSANDHWAAVQPGASPRN